MFNKDLQTLFEDLTIDQFMEHFKSFVIPGCLRKEDLCRFIINMPLQHRSRVSYMRLWVDQQRYSMDDLRVFSKVEAALATQLGPVICNAFNQRVTAKQKQAAWEAYQRAHIARSLVYSALKDPVKLTLRGSDSQEDYA